MAVSEVERRDGLEAAETILAGGGKSDKQVRKA